MINVTLQQMINQQQVLAALGFYKGKIDGIWSEETIKAKQSYEFDRTFMPALPNNGLPFDTAQKLPRGLIRKGSYIWCPQLDTYLKEQENVGSKAQQQSSGADVKAVETTAASKQEQQASK